MDSGAIAEIISRRHNEKVAKNTIELWKEIQLLPNSIKADCYLPHRQKVAQLGGFLFLALNSNFFANTGKKQPDRWLNLRLSSPNFSSNSFCNCTNF